MVSLSSTSSERNALRGLLVVVAQVALAATGDAVAAVEELLLVAGPAHVPDYALLGEKLVRKESKVSD